MPHYAVQRQAPDPVLGYPSTQIPGTFEVLGVGIDFSGVKCEWMEFPPAFELDGVPVTTKRDYCLCHLDFATDILGIHIKATKHVYYDIGMKATPADKVKGYLATPHILVATTTLEGLCIKEAGPGADSPPELTRPLEALDLAITNSPRVPSDYFSLGWKAFSRDFDLNRHPRKGLCLCVKQGKQEQICRTEHLHG